jgi:hypothetical protein
MLRVPHGNASMEMTTESGLTHSPRKTRLSDEFTVTNILLSALLAAVLLGSVAYYMLVARTPKLLQTEYQAVLLDNGAAYFGKTVQMTRDFITLSDVYYVQSQTNPGTKEVSNVLIKRGKEWHGPDRMVINRQHLALMEPVAPDSKVAQLIAESRRQ